MTSPTGDAAPPPMSFRALSVSSRLLMVNQFGINVGFYLVLPFLATYMGGLGYATATIGMVLALRHLSQQGLFLVGGSAADRFGTRPVIITGCVLRTVAFGLFAVFDTLPGLILAAVLTGLAGALFNPAVRAHLMQEAGRDEHGDGRSTEDRRAGTFALFELVAHTGALAGLLGGALLLAVDFRLVALVACVVFVVLTGAQLFALPANDVAPRQDPVLGSWWEVMTDRRFLLFSAGGAAYFALYNQLYLALPIEAQRVSGVPAAVSAVFVVFVVVVIVGQVRITAWCRARWSAGRSMATGLAVMGAGFLPLGLAAPFLPGAVPGPWDLAGLLAVAPVLVGTVIFTVGAAMTSPFSMALIPVVGSERLAGTYYGFFYLVSAIAVTGVNTVVGALIDVTAGEGTSWVPFAVLTVVGLAGACVVAVMQQRGALDPQSPVGCNSMIRRVVAQGTEQRPDSRGRGPAVAATWSRRAAAYERFYLAYPEARREAWRRACRQWLGERPRRVLDVGTGTGFLATVLAEAGHDVVGVDLAEDMLPRARNEARRRGVDVAWHRCAADRVEGLPALAGGVDVVTARYVLWTLPDPAAALAAWRRTLRPGGTLLVLDGLWQPRRRPTPLPRLRPIANRLVLGRHLPHWRGLEETTARALLDDAGFVDVQDVLPALERDARPAAESVLALTAHAPAAPHHPTDDPGGPR